jgi:hypothetical protein
MSLAKSSFGGSVMCRPIFEESKSAFVDIQDMRHPCVSPK